MKHLTNIYLYFEICAFGKILQPPEPPAPWLGIRNATERSPMCMQNTNYVNQLDAIIQGDEDCLYLDVFKPQVRRHF